MRNFQTIALGLFLSLVSITGAVAQCGTQAPANKFCGNDTGSPALATWKSVPTGALSPIVGGTVLGNRGTGSAVPTPLTNPVLGIPGTSTGEVGFAGATSGTATLRAQAVAGSSVSLLPTAAGTLVGTAGSPLAINATTGQITCATCVTSSGGGSITGTAPISVSAAGVVSINAPYVSLTASNGGIVYSGSTNLAILSGTATARQMLQSGAGAAPAWSTAVWPATTTINQILYSSAANNVTGITTANDGVLVTNSSGVPSISSTLPPNLTTLGPLTITPTAASNNSGIVITQSTPNTGSVAGPISLNLITVTDQGQTVTGSGIDSFGQIFNQTTALRINETITGGTLTNHFGISVAQNITGSNVGASPIVGGTYTNVGGPITGNQWGLIGYVNVGPSGNLNASAIAMEAEVLVATGGTLKDRVGLSINSQGPVNATGTDAGIVLNLLAGTVTGYTDSPAPFKDGIYFSKDFYSANAFPIATTGNVMRGDTGTVANFASFANLTVTGNILNFPNMAIGGSGNAIFGAGSGSLVSSAVTATFNVNTQALFQVNNNSAGTSAFPAFSASNGTGAATFGIGGTAYTGVGGFVTNKAFVFSNATANGIAVYASGATPIDFYVNGARAGGFTTAGAFTLNTSLSSPIVYGGSAAGSTLTLASTSGAGTTDTISLQTGSQVTRMTVLSNGNIGVGKETSPQASFVVSSNVTTGIAAPANTTFMINGADTTATVLLFQSWGSGQNPTILMRAANGTAASFSASLSGDVLGFYSAKGAQAANTYDGATQSGLYIGAGENHSAGNNGTFIAFLTVPNASASRAEAIRVLGSGGLAIGTTSDPGTGLIYLNSASFLMRNKTSWSNGAAAAAGTLANAPAAGNPTKWIPIDDNGTTRYIPAW